MHRFPHDVVGWVDGFPIKIAEPSCRETHRVVNNGKYQAPTIKAEAICSHKGKLLNIAFPFVGVRNDAEMRKMVEASGDTPLEGNEKLGGDRAYKANKKVVVAYIKPANKKGEPPKYLNQAQKTFNRKYNQVRQRIEIVIGHIKNRPIFRKVFKGEMRNLYT